jgi:hypothetical protein
LAVWEAGDSLDGVLPWQHDPAESAAGRSRRGHRGAPGREEAQGGALGADNGRRRGSMVMPSWAGQTALARKLLQRAARAGA